MTPKPVSVYTETSSKKLKAVIKRQESVIFQLKSKLKSLTEQNKRMQNKIDKIDRLLGPIQEKVDALKDINVKAQALIRRQFKKESKTSKEEKNMSTETLQKLPKEDPYHNWDNCLTDVLLNILRMMPMQTLFVCMFINRTWRNHVEYLIEVKNKWIELFSTITAYSEQLLTKTTSSNWQQIYHNYILWHNVDKATVKLEQVININHIKGLRIYQGKLIVNTTNYVRFYSPKTMIKRGMLQMNCRDYYETDCLIMVVAENEKSLTLHIFKKPPRSAVMCDMDEYILSIIENVLCYKFLDDRCFFIDDRNSLYESFVLNGQWTCYFVSRFYGTPGPKLTMHINIINNRIYLLYKDGTMLWVDPVQRNFIKLLQQAKDLSKKRKKIYKKHLPWYCIVDNDKPMCNGNNQVESRGRLNIDSSLYTSKFDVDVFLHEVVGVSCMLQYGDLLFLGYDDGTIEIASPRNSESIRRFNLRDLQEDLTDLRILSIEIYEEDDQYLYIATSTQLFRFCISHENCDEDMWRDEVFRRCIGEN